MTGTTLPETLSQQVKAGFLWTTGFNIFRDILQFGMMLVLTRLLDPTAYGQFGLVMSIIGFFAVFGFGNFLEYTFQVRPGVPIDYQTQFTIGFVIQSLVFILVNLAAFLFRYSETYAAISKPLHVMSVFFLLNLVWEFRVRMLERALDWKRLRILQAVGMVGNAAAAILLAIGGFRTYALLVPSLIMTLPGFYDLFWRETWRPTWECDLKKFRPALRYGMTRIASGLLNSGRMLLESSVIVQVVGFLSFGVFGRAVGLANLCCLKFTSAFLLVLFPILTKVEPGTSSYQRAGSLVLRTVAWMVIPAATLVAMFADVVVRLVYGTKWVDAIPLVPWAIVSVAITALTQTVSLLLLANLQQQKCLISDAVILVGTAASLLFVLTTGTSNYLMAVGATQLLALMLAVSWLIAGKGITANAIWTALAMPTLGACGMVFLGRLLPGFTRSLGQLPWTMAYGLVSLLFYILFLRIMARNGLAELIDHCPGRDRLRRLLLLDFAVKPA